MDNEQSQAKGQNRNRLLLSATSITKTASSLGRSAASNETPAPRAIQNTALETHRCAASGFPAAEISS
ncbi:hypothetical protein DPMN_098990 [Dreissena polymorpha]|uniref:Uncharacterized protein n=1 Tax=Dreissena polymorpha TaxID=45954 RepID=A0A9D4LD44_DREPO|nr:hypothetical protein DPMN_098990 [Dreissena polymorpha]